MIPGQPVFWTPRGRGKPILTSVRRVELLRRADGSEIQCATLSCNRFVPVTDLRTLDQFSAESAAIDSHKPAIDSHKPAIDSPEPFTLTGSRKSTPAPKPEPRPAKTLEIPAPKPEPVAAGQPGLRFLLLIDFNNLLVRAWHAGKPTEIHAVKSMFLTVASAVRALRPEAIVFCLDGGHDHRAKLLASYKAHRKPSDPDLVRQRQLAIDAISAAGLQCIRADGFEADDVIGTLASRHFGSVVLSSDKDLLQLDGRNGTRIFEPWGVGKFVTPDDKLSVFAGQVVDLLALCGDTSDGVPGVRGIGEKTAVELLQKYDCLENILSAARTLRIPGAAGKKLLDGTADALLSQRLVELVTTLPIDPPRLWNPRPGWQQNLTAMKLGAVAGILDGLADVLPTGESFLVAAGNPHGTPPAVDVDHETTRGPDAFDTRHFEKHPAECESPGLSAATEKAEQPGRGELLADHQPLQPDPPPLDCPEEFRTPPDSVVPVEPSEQSFSTRANSTGQDRTLFAGSADNEQLTSPPGLSLELEIEHLDELEKDGIRWQTPAVAAVTAVTCWLAGRRFRSFENPWRKDTWNYLAWQQGAAGIPLSVVVEN